MSQKIFLDRTLDNELYTSNGNDNDLVNNESIKDNTAMFSLFFGWEGEFIRFL